MRPHCVEGELLVKFKGGPRGPAAERAQAVMKHEVKRHFDFIGWQHIGLPAGMTVEEGLAHYRNLPDVLAVEPNALARAIAPIETPANLMLAAGTMTAVPNDPRFDQQWSLAKIGATNAWALSTGSADVVAVVTDSGVNYNHEDLQANMWRNPGEIPGNGIDDDGNGWIDDVYGIDAINDDGDPFPTTGDYHGTGVAGVIGAVGDNGLGLAGINWSVRIMAIRLVMGSELIPLADRLQAFNYILLMKSRGMNIRVVNMSWGDSNYYEAQQDALAALDAAGILMVAATLNSSTDVDITPDYPGNHQLPGIIVVADSDVNDSLYISGYGRTNVDLAAPGAAVSLVWGPGNSNYSSGSGTSFAAPHVTGAVALLAAANPAASAAEIKAALLESVDVLPAFTNRMVSNGRLNVGRAVLHPYIASGPPFIVTQPASEVVVLSNYASFGVGSAGTRPHTYQWLRNGTPLTDATNATLNVSNVTFGHAGDYSVVITNFLGAVTSRVASLTVAPLWIASQPKPLGLRPGANGTNSVSVVSPEPPAYQWHFGDTPIPGATNTILIVTNVQLAHDGDYRVAVSNRFGGAVSDAVRLTVLINPIIAQAPLSQSVVAGGNATFSVSFTGNPKPFGVEWRRASAPRASNTVFGAQDFFILTNAQPADATTWRVVVKNQANTNVSTGESRSFTLTVLADSDGDGLPDSWEMAHGFPTNNAANATLDSDGDGLTDRQEYQAGTDPTNALSFLKVESVSMANDGSAAQLTFVASSNTTYTVQSRVSVDAGAWMRVVDVVASATNRLMEVLDTSDPPPNSHRYYRLVTPRVP